MNILIQFEDTFGVYELFKRYNKGISGYNVKVENNISSPGILVTSRSTIAKNSSIDKIIIVFDLDPISGRDTLDGSKLRDLLRKWLLDKDYRIKPLYVNRVVLIPSFYCYETLYLYSYIFKDVIKICNEEDEEIDHKIITLYKKYYDYSKINPESLFNINNIIECIRLEVSALKNTSQNWTIQKFHQAYTEQILRSLFRNVSHDKDLRQIFIKKEDRMFDAIDRLENNYTSKELIDSIVDGMKRQSIHNYRLCKLITATSIDSIKSMILTDESLEELCKELDEYQSSIQGIKKDICDLIDENSVNADLIFNKQ